MENRPKFEIEYFQEINDLSVEGLKEFKRARFQKKVNDVLWSIFVGGCVGVVSSYFLYQIFTN